MLGSAVQIVQPGKLSCQPALPGEWRILPETVQLIWRRFGDAQVGLFASQFASCFTPCPRGPSAQTHWHTVGLRAYANMCFPQWAFSHRHCAPLDGAILAQSDLVPRTDVPRDSPSLENSSEEGSPFFSERGHPLAPTSRLVESPRVVPGWQGFRCVTASSSKHHNFSQSTVYKTGCRGTCSLIGVLPAG